MKKIILIFVIALTAIPILAQEKVSVMKPALIVIDIQNQYRDYIPDSERELGIYMMNAAIYLFRQHNLPVIRIYHTDPQSNRPAPGTDAFEFWEEVAVEADDIKVVKNFPSAFKKTELDKILKEKEINSIFLVGLSSVGCVLATYHSGNYNDYNTFMIKDAIMSHEKKFTDVIEEAYGAISWEALKFMLDYGRME